MEDDRYPKICFNRLKKLAEYDNASPKFNWFVQINEYFFKKIDESHFWSNLTLEKLVLEKNNLITKMSSFLEKNDQECCKNSSSLALYPNIYNIEKKINYLDVRLPAYYKKIIAQLRMYNLYIPRILLKNMTLKTNDEYCNYCNERNDLIHMLVYCTRFRHKDKNCCLN